jgi:hypothetical protein
MEGTTCAFVTPMGVRCLRNPNDPEQAPCGKRSSKKIVKKNNISKKMLNYVSDMDPQNCIGNACSEAALGSWSEPLRESLLWFKGFLQNQYPDISSEELKVEAESFIAQYEPDLKKVFGNDLIDIVEV